MAMTHLGEIIEHLQDFSLTDLKDKREPAISKLIYLHLKNKGLRVANEKQIGFLKFYIDIDYMDGKAGVEIKLAESLINDAGGKNGEVQRLLGQTYYYNQHYTNIVPVVMVLVVGKKTHEKHVNIKEVQKHIENIGAKFHYISTID